jgi:exosortase
LRLVPAALCGAACAALFQFWGNATRGYIATDSLFYWWGFQWVNPESETEHAWLVLALSLFLLRRNLRRAGPDPSTPGAAAGAAFALGLLLHALGFVAQQPRLSIVALLLCAWGVLALAGGRRWGRASAFPLAFMVFAIPVNALDTVGFWLRMWVVQAGERVAHLVGIGVQRNGTQLFSPDGRFQYDVVAACSGIRSLMALSALALFIGYLWLRPAWLRCAVLALGLPLVYLGNVLRIVAIIIAAQSGGQAWGDRIHDVMGFGVFIVVIGGVIALAETAARLRPDWAEGEGARPAAAPSARPAGPGSASLAVAVVLAVAAEAAYLSHRSSAPLDDRPGVVLAADGSNPAELPTFLGSDWMGRRLEPEPIERAILPPDTGYSRKLYVNLERPDEHALLSIVLSGRDRTSIHRPELCLVGQGWTIRSSFRHEFTYPGATAGLPATVLRIDKEVSTPAGRARVPQLFAYYFVGRDIVVATQWERIARDAWDRVRHGRSDRWAYVVVQTGSSDGEAAALRRIQAILDGALPAFQGRP